MKGSERGATRDGEKIKDEFGESVRHLVSALIAGFSNKCAQSITAWCYSLCERDGRDVKEIVYSLLIPASNTFHINLVVQIFISQCIRLWASLFLFVKSIDTEAKLAFVRGLSHNFDEVSNLFSPQDAHQVHVNNNSCHFDRSIKQYGWGAV